MSSDFPSHADETPESGPGLGVADIYFALFRRKWFVIAGFLLGLGIAGVLWKTKAPLFESTAKLMVGYIRDVSPNAGLGPGSQVRSAVSGGGNPLGSEREILTSLDVARAAAEAVGPCRIVPKGWLTNDCSQAPNIILRNLMVDIPPQIDVITLRFQHPDPDVAQAVLREVIKAYLKKHHDVHSDIGGSSNFLAQRREQLRTQLLGVDTELKTLKERVGILSLEDFKKANAVEETHLRQELHMTEADLEQRKAMLQEAQKSEVRPAGTNAPGGTLWKQAPPLKVKEYRDAVAKLERLQQRDEELLRMWTPAADVVKTNRLQIQVAQQYKDSLEREYPALLRAPDPVASGPGSSVFPNALTGASEPSFQPAAISGLIAKLNIISNQLAEVQAKAKKVEEVDTKITQLQKQQELLETQLRDIELALQQRRFDQVLGSVTGIQMVQDPSPPARGFRALYKQIGMAVLGGLGFGIGLAFLWELVLDRSLRRPKDISGMLFLSIPALRLGKARKARRSTSVEVPEADPGNASLAPALASTVAFHPDSAFKRFHDALRDRLVTYFEVRNMTHMPKMIAVTSCNEGAGVSSVASGLAASLSETGEGNVLLVDMRGGPGSAHAFSHGRPACTLKEALEDDLRPNALVHGNLYAVSAGSAASPQDPRLDRIIPPQFGAFVPKLRASDYEYIVFDMPPVAPTSATARVARFMDMVLLVVEAGKTNSEVAARANALLAESRATVATVLNKRRRYVPKWLLQEFD